MIGVEFVCIDPNAIHWKKIANILKTYKNYRHKLFLKRLGAWYYKEYRDIYELHKSCFLKFGFTFVIVLIQIMCDRNYTCRKNQENKLSDAEKSFDNSRTSPFDSKKQTKNTIELNSSDDELKNTLYVCEQCQNTSVNPHSCHPKSRGVTFNNLDSTLAFPPSFNLQSAQKSTPKRLNQNQFKNSPNGQQFASLTSSNSFQTAQLPAQTLVTIESNPNYIQNADETIV